MAKAGEIMNRIGKILKKNPQIAVALSAAGSALVKTGVSILTKPGVIANVKHIFSSKKSGKYSVEEVAEVEKNAEWVANYLRENKIIPNRIGIDGLPGSGKSTLAKALSQRLNMEWISLDHKLPDRPYQFEEDNCIYEHHRLYRTQDLDEFDMILFIDLPVETIKEQIIDRGRGAIHIEIFEYDLMQGIGKYAFEIADGETIHVPGTYLRIKIRPKDGFHANENLDKKLAAVSYEDTGKLGKEEKLFLLYEGKTKKGRSAYIQGSKYAQQLLENIAQELVYYVPTRGSRGHFR